MNFVRRAERFLLLEDKIDAGFGFDDEGVDLVWFVRETATVEVSAEELLGDVDGFEEAKIDSVVFEFRRFDSGTTNPNGDVLSANRWNCRRRSSSRIC